MRMGARRDQAPRWQDGRPSAENARMADGRRLVLPGRRIGAGTSSRRTLTGLGFRRAWLAPNRLVRPRNSPRPSPADTTVSPTHCTPVAPWLACPTSTPPLPSPANTHSSSMHNSSSMRPHGRPNNRRPPRRRHSRPRMPHKSRSSSTHTISSITELRPLYLPPDPASRTSPAGLVL